ncbi:MAG TPA: DUF1361 domain-containing protein [Ferruginibacter sp.]|nr:DUF1361 domain-containing protein [Ferruginibacter sp.]
MNKLPVFERFLLGWFFFIACLISARIYFSGSLLFIFLVWNIFLAWIPFAVSSYLRPADDVKWKHYVLLFVWLAFFPNSLYIITDLIHLDKETRIPKWFDAVLIFSAAVAGLMMAFISLYRVERFLLGVMRKQWVNALLLLILFLGSFGVYLGRFLRWNSWDIISNPGKLFASIGKRVLFPMDHPYAWGVTGILTVLFYLLYFSIKNLPGYVYRAKSEQ